MFLSMELPALNAPGKTAGRRLAHFLTRDPRRTRGRKSRKIGTFLSTAFRLRSCAVHGAPAGRARAPTRGRPHETCTNRRRPGCSCKRHASLGPGGASTLPPPGDLWRFRKANAQVGEPWTAGPMDIYVHRPLTAAFPQAASPTRRRRRGRQCAPARWRAPAGRRAPPGPQVPPPPLASAISEILRLRALRALRSG